jgi:undecaprenyl diphosphate synthase
LPRHVAIIMDGNGRWATRRGLSRIQGHRRGKDSVRAIVEKARELGIEYLTLYAFSSENWQRPAREVGALMQLLRRYLRSEVAKMMRYGIRLRAIGNLRKLPSAVLSEMREVERKTARNDRMTVLLAVSYGSREEITRAARALARRVRDGALAAEDIDEEVFASALGTAGIPDPDLLIRTSGEMRLSNFLLWQLAYTEIYVTDTLWPDFREPEFLLALEDYKRRQRRFGRTTEQLAQEA